MSVVAALGYVNIEVERDRLLALIDGNILAVRLQKDFGTRLDRLYFLLGPFLGSQFLQLLLQRADAKSLDVAAERAVYNDATATADDLTAAIQSTQRTLGLIIFADARAEKLCVNEWEKSK